MKVQGVYQRKVTTRTLPEYDFLKYWRVIRFWVKKKYGLSISDMEMLLFLYSEQIFNKSKFKEYGEIMSWDTKRFKRLLSEGWIHVWRKRQGQETTLYELTYKGKRVMRTIYDKINGKEISELAFTNPLFSSDPSYADNVNRNMIVKMNKETKSSTD
tara:strand:- start:651 stop:1121 length:471 start_codon:yes stop_codon:yes gene_type:complete